jgi:hypothetical protein
LGKIAENKDHNIDPRFQFEPCWGKSGKQKMTSYICIHTYIYVHMYT